MSPHRPDYPPKTPPPPKRHWARPRLSSRTLYRRLRSRSEVAAYELGLHPERGRRRPGRPRGRHGPETVGLPAEGRPASEGRRAAAPRVCAGRRPTRLPAPGRQREPQPGDAPGAQPPTGHAAGRRRPGPPGRRAHASPRRPRPPRRRCRDRAERAPAVGGARSPAARSGSGTGNPSSPSSLRATENGAPPCLNSADRRGRYSAGGGEERAAATAARAAPRTPGPRSAGHGCRHRDAGRTRCPRFGSRLPTGRQRSARRGARPSRPCRCSPRPTMSAR